MNNDNPDATNNLPPSGSSAQESQQPESLAEEPKHISGSERLALISKELKEGKQPEPVRILLGWFGYYRRGSWGVVYISDRLNEAGVSTEPDFRSVWLDAQISFVLVQRFPFP